MHQLQGGICVIKPMMKILGRIIKERLVLIPDSSETQCGFTTEKSCINQIFTLWQLMEKLRDKG